MRALITGRTGKLEAGVRLILVSVLAISTFVSCSSAETSVSAPNTGVFEATHNIPIENLGDAFQYWNLDWKERAPQLYGEIIAVNTLYTQSHTYILGQTDCDDMAASIWETLAAKGIISLIVVGNLEMAQESSNDCNHAWLMIYSGDGSAAALETTNGEVYTWQDTEAEPWLEQYWEGFIYEKPSDLWRDFRDWW